MLLLVGCKLASKRVQQQAAEKRLTGSWVCANVLDEAAYTKSIKQLKNFPPYTELIFLQDSSKLIALNGQVDMVTLSYTCSGSLLLVPDFYGNSVAQISMAGDSLLLFNDDFSAQTWRYVKAADGVDSSTDGSIPEVFPSLLNSVLVAGEYTVKNAEKVRRVVIHSNGNISNIPDFTHYSLCYNGGCNSLSDENLVYISDGQQGDFYGWNMQGSTLTIYSLLVVNAPDEIMTYRLDKPILVLEKAGGNGGF
jgi:hypothetical protein